MIALCTLSSYSAVSIIRNSRFSPPLALHPFANVDCNTISSIKEIPFFVCMGASISVLGIIFVRVRQSVSSLYKLTVPYLHYSLRPLVGILIMLFSLNSKAEVRNYGITAGMKTMKEIINEKSKEKALILAKDSFASRWVMTPFIQGSGVVGGMFAPALFMGSAFGYLYHATFDRFRLVGGLSSSSVYTIIGALGFLGMIFRAPVTALVMCMETTKSYKLLPGLITVLISSAKSFDYLAKVFKVNPAVKHQEESNKESSLLSIDGIKKLIFSQPSLIPSAQIPFP